MNEIDTGEMEYTFDWKNPTAQMLGRWQPWHEGHRELFKRAHAMCGQVCIMIREVPSNREANSRVPGQDDNPFSWEDVCKNIEENLLKDGYERGKEYEIMLVPNVTNITYGRGVGYVFEEESFDEEISSISATKIRSELREKGKL